jgi:hypothetical protein
MPQRAGEPLVVSYLFFLPPYSPRSRFRRQATRSSLRELMPSNRSFEELGSFTICRRREVYEPTILQDMRRWVGLCDVVAFVAFLICILAHSLLGVRVSIYAVVSGLK